MSTPASSTPSHGQEAVSRWTRPNQANAAGRVKDEDRTDPPGSTIQDLHAGLAVHRTATMAVDGEQHPERVADLSGPLPIGVAHRFVRRPACPIPHLVIDPAVAIPLIDIASRDLRKRVAEGKSIRFLVPRAVEEYVRDRNLYRS